jgi:DNA-binding response OmpR family regulator
MTIRSPQDEAPPKLPSVLVVDDDRRVRELLEIALTAHGFHVLTASDGEEALKRAASERPDLVVLDVRLPKRSGLEVCEALRRDHEDPAVPIILVSAAAETDARLQAFARGADDYLSKPFSPKELVARIKRLLSRSAEARNAVRRAQQLERELSRAQDEARRAHLESRREHGLRELALGLGRELLLMSDGDALGERLLLAVHTHTGAHVAGLWMRDRSGSALEGAAFRGEGRERFAGLEPRLDGELLRVLAGLGRMASCAELERIPEVKPEIAPFIARGFVGLAPLVGEDGIVAMFAWGEPRQAAPEAGHARHEVLAGLCEIGAIAIQNAMTLRARTDRLLEQLYERALSHSPIPAARAEAASLVTRAARGLFLSHRQQDLSGLVVALEPWARELEGRQAIERMRVLDPTGRVAELEGLIQRLERPSEPNPLDAGEPRILALLEAGLAYARARERGEGIEDALTRAISHAPLDVASRHALESASRQGIMLEGHAA